jgi:hypothetical protein
MMIIATFSRAPCSFTGKGIDTASGHIASFRPILNQ